MKNFFFGCIKLIQAHYSRYEGTPQTGCQSYITTKSRLHMKKQSVDLLMESKTMNNLQFFPEGRTRIVNGTIVDVPSEYQNIIKELQKNTCLES